MSRTTEIPLSLNDLAPETREWLLRKSTSFGIPPQSVMVRTLDECALRERAADGRPIPPMPAPPSHKAA